MATLSVDSAQIRTGAVQNLHVASGLDASKITVGYMYADRIQGGTLNFTYVTAANLTVTGNAVVGGTLNCAAFTVTNLNVSVIAAAIAGQNINVGTGLTFTAGGQALTITSSGIGIGTSSIGPTGLGGNLMVCGTGGFTCYGAIICSGNINAASYSASGAAGQNVTISYDKAAGGTGTLTFSTGILTSYT